MCGSWCSGCGVLDSCYDPNVASECHGCGCKFDSSVMIANPFRYLSQMLSRKDLNGRPLVQPFKPDDDPLLMSGTASGKYYRSLIEEFGQDSVYCGLTADGVDPMNK